VRWSPIFAPEARALQLPPDGSRGASDPELRNGATRLALVSLGAVLSDPPNLSVGWSRGLEAQGGAANRLEEFPHIHLPAGMEREGALE
jgi:hypothetical protein